MDNNNDKPSIGTQLETWGKRLALVGQIIYYLILILPVAGGLLWGAVLLITPFADTLVQVLVAVPAYYALHILRAHDVYLDDTVPKWKRIYIWICYGVAPFVMVATVMVATYYLILFQSGEWKSIGGVLLWGFTAAMWLFTLIALSTSLPTRLVLNCFSLVASMHNLQKDMVAILKEFSSKYRDDEVNRRIEEVSRELDQ